MSDGVLVALITTLGGVLGGVMLLIRRLLPPRRARSGDVDMDSAWTEIRRLRSDVDQLVNDRNVAQTTARILADSNDALTSAVARAIPPVVFTLSEQQSIDRAKARRTEDGNTWPTLGGRPTTA